MKEYDFISISTVNIKVTKKSTASLDDNFKPYNIDIQLTGKVWTL